MLVEFGGERPKVHETAFVHPSAVVIGNVTLGEHSSVWPGAVVRGDFAEVEIGDYTCIQDNTVVHPADVYPGEKPEYIPVKIGSHVIVGHRALIHGASISNNCVVGGGSIVFNGAKVGENSLIGMGATVLAGTEVPPGTIMVGVPARPLRKLRDEEIARIREQAENYAKLAERYKTESKQV